MPRVVSGQARAQGLVKEMKWVTVRLETCCVSLSKGAKWKVSEKRLFGLPANGELSFIRRGGEWFSPATTREQDVST